MRLNMAQIAEEFGGTLIGEGLGVPLGAFIDSRDDGKEKLFFALRGEHVDGREFAAQAIARGALGAVVERAIPGLQSPQIVVKSSLAALQSYGSLIRGTFSGRIAAITGSCGKTTTRNILTTLLKMKFDTLEPKRNFNNHIGVPLTLSELSENYGAAVIEMGCSDFGEIAFLTGLANPEVGLITNIGPAHLEKLKDLDGVARAKGELFKGLDKSATAVVNADDERVAGLEFTTRTKIYYGTGKGADIRLVSSNPNGNDGQKLEIDLLGQRLNAKISLLGRHNAFNALAASAAASAMGLCADEISVGLESAKAYPGRLELRKGSGGFTIIDDTYNANPSSMKAAMEVLKELVPKGNRIAVLADMLELGEETERAHVEIGESVAQMNIKLLVTMGDRGYEIGKSALAHGFDRSRWVHAVDHESAAIAVSSTALASDAVLVKGSRGRKMETVVKKLTGDRCFMNFCFRCV